jgi:DNA topoisomerase-2
MAADAPKAKQTKHVAVEKIYQKKTQLEHILLRPDTYIGSVERVEQEMWIWDMDASKMVKKNIKYVPGLFKIFDEILGKKRKGLFYPVLK